MADLKLTPEQTNALQVAIGDTHSQGAQIMQQISGDYSSLAGAAWRGAASTAALGKQQEFQDIWQNLSQILTDLSEGITGTTKAIGAQDDDYQNMLNAVDGGGMNFGRL